MEAMIQSGTILVYLGDIIEVYIYHLMLNTFYTPRKWITKTKTLFFSLFGLTYFMMAFLHTFKIAPLNLLAMFLGFFFPLLVGYKIDNIRGICYFFFYLMASFVGEGVVAATLHVRYTGYDAHFEMITPGVAMMLTLYALVIAYLICFFGNKEKNPVYNRVTLYFTLVPIVSIIFFARYLTEYIHGQKDGITGSLLTEIAMATFIINITVFVVLEKYTSLLSKHMTLHEQNLKLEAESDILEISTKSMKERLAITEQNMQKDRIMRHDRRHFEAMILSLLNEGKIGEAKSLLEERINAEPRTSAKYCDNLTINAEVSHYVAKAENLGIDLDVKMNVPPVLKIDELEFAIAFANLFENAIHGCEQLKEEHRAIKVTSKYKDQLLLEIANTCSKSVELDKEGHPFTNEKGHGVGTKSVLAFVNKTDSEISYSCGDGIFRVRMIINA